MSNERIRAERGEDWPDNDDDYPVLLKGEALDWGVHLVYFSAAERADAFIDQINGAPAAPSEGVRPVPPVPEPERVHYMEAVGRLVPGEDEPIQVAVGWGVAVRADAAVHVVQADADGLVSVLPLGDPK